VLWKLDYYHDAVLAEPSTLSENRPMLDTMADDAYSITFQAITNWSHLVS